MSKTGIVVDKLLLLENCVEQYTNIMKYFIKATEDFVKIEENLSKIETFPFSNKECPLEKLYLVHDKEYVNKIEKFKYSIEEIEEKKWTEDKSFEGCEIMDINFETTICKHSPKILRLQTQSLIELSEKVYYGDLKNGFMIGGGGHHASRVGGEG
jgi:acetoin utilization deacetylase AcuC-like enzyme